MDFESQLGVVKRKREESPETRERRLAARRERDRERKRNNPKLMSPEEKERRLEKRRELYRKNKRLKEIGLSIAISRNKILGPPHDTKTAAEVTSSNSREVCPKCNVFMDDSFGINHAYCKSVALFDSKRTKIVQEKSTVIKNGDPQEKELVNKSEDQVAIDRKKMMEEILRSHYLEQAKDEVFMSSPSEEENGEEEQPDCFQCEKCEFVCETEAGLKQHIYKSHTPKQNMFFHFPNFLGFNCSLMGSHFQSELYYVTEVSQPQKSENISLPDNLSETCYFFIPLKIIKLYPDIKTWVNTKIPYYNSKRNGFNAKFPNSRHPVTWAVNLTAGKKCVDLNEMFIFTKSRFKLIQSIRSGKDQRAYGAYGAFCKFLDEDQTKIENFIRIKTEPLFETNTTTPEESPVPQITLDTYSCPWDDCNFVSDKKFSGIRNHLLKHFKEKIEEGARPRAMLSEREKSNCMSKTGCSVPTLKARGELVHHYGLFHCLVDDYFQDFAFAWIQDKYTAHFIKNICPYEDHTYEDESAFLEHLTTSHYFNMILGEVEDMVRFSIVFSDEKKALTNTYKCPFCKKKFSNMVEGGNIRDVREMVVHCGAEHGFALYYLMVDKQVESMRELLVRYRIKEEPKDEDDLAIESVQTKTTEELLVVTPVIKMEPQEETEVNINNFVKTELDDYIKVKEEPMDPFEEQ